MCRVHAHVSCPLRAPVLSLSLFATVCSITRSDAHQVDALLPFARVERSVVDIELGRERRPRGVPIDLEPLLLPPPA